MSGPSFDRVPLGAGGRERRVAGIVAAVLLAFIGVAFVKPWGSPSATSDPSGSVARVSPAAVSPSTSSPERPSPTSSATTQPLEAFTTPVPPGAGATWTGLTWRRLAADDPFRLVIFTLRWRSGFIAVGWDSRRGTPQVMWTSDDGSHWLPLPLDSTTIFPARAELRALVERQGGVAALTQGPVTDGRGPVDVWVSADARNWDAVVVPEDLQVPYGLPAPLLASGPAGLLLASTGKPSRTLRATGAGGWRFTERARLPERFDLTDLRGTATGYVAVGQWTEDGGESVPATLWSPDGLHWPSTPTRLPVPRAPHSGVGGAFTFLNVGRDGMIARQAGETRPELWWRSPDGRQWRSLPSYPPLGAAEGTCDSVGCYPEPDGTLVDDGSHLVAIRGNEAGAWDSTDGRTWRRMTMTGDVPVAPARPVTLLPGGVIYSDGSTTWFGEAVVR